MYWLFRKYIAEEPIVWTNKKPIVCMQRDSSARAANTRVDDTDIHCVFREVTICCSEYPCTRWNVLWRDIMCNINDVGVRSYTGNNAFHYTYIIIAQTKVGHQSDNWTCKGDSRLGHAVFLPFLSLYCYAGDVSSQKSQ